MNIKELNLHPELVRAIKELGFTDATSIQEKCIPEILKGRDITGQSSTGSGKTAAFGLPILQRITPGGGLQVLILTPTRELCVQDADALAIYGKFLHVKVASVYGGVGLEPQVSAMRTADIVVGTPGRILDHLTRGNVRFGTVKILVLDEADKMFEMGFIEDVEKIISQTPKERQTLLFGATLSKAIHNLAKKHLKSPVVIRSLAYVDKSLLKQRYYDVKNYDKFSLLIHLLRQNTQGLSMVFCATRREADLVAENLKMQGIKANAIHGGLTQQRRLKTLEDLKKGHFNVLVATDVAARGLDIKDVTNVYNYDVPKTSVDYVHRIGRTARAKASGEAITLLCEKDYDNFNNVLRDISLEIPKAAPISYPKVSFVRGHSEQRPFRRPFHRR